MMVFNKMIRSQKGMATGFAITVGVILASISFSVLLMSRTTNNLDLNLHLFYSTAAIVRANITSMVVNTDAWNQTVAGNQGLGTMTCINSGSNCAAGTIQDINLFLPSGATYYDYPSQGFTHNGSVCAYNSTTTTSGCVMRVRIQWRPFCAGFACLVPPNRVVYELTFDVPQDSPVYNKFNASKVDGFIGFANPYR